jgi:hypothetical protein
MNAVMLVDLGDSHWNEFHGVTKQQIALLRAVPITGNTWIGTAVPPLVRRGRQTCVDAAPLGLLSKLSISLLMLTVINVTRQAAASLWQFQDEKSEINLTTHYEDTAG